MQKSIKNILFLTATLIWVVVIYTILTNNQGFEKQAPSCILSTAAIFGVALMIIKAIDFKSKKDELQKR